MPTVKFILTVLMLFAAVWRMAVWSGTPLEETTRLDQPPVVRESLEAVMSASTPEAAEAAGHRLQNALVLAKRMGKDFDR